MSHLSQRAGGVEAAWTRDGGSRGNGGPEQALSWARGGELTGTGAALFTPRTPSTLFPPRCALTVDTVWTAPKDALPAAPGWMWSERRQREAGWCSLSSSLSQGMSQKRRSVNISWDVCKLKWTFTPKRKHPQKKGTIIPETNPIPTVNPI